MEGARSPAPGRPDCMPSRLGRRPVSARRGRGRRARRSPQECRAFRGADSTRAPAARPTGLGETPEGRLRRGDLPTLGFANIWTPPSPSPCRAPQALGPTGPAPQKRRRPPGAAHSASASALRLGSTSLGWSESSGPRGTQCGQDSGNRGCGAQLGAGAKSHQEREKVWAPPHPKVTATCGHIPEQEGPSGLRQSSLAPFSRSGPLGTLRRQAAALCAGTRSLPAGTARWCIRTRGPSRAKSWRSASTQLQLAAGT